MLSFAWNSYRTHATVASTATKIVMNSYKNIITFIFIRIRTKQNKWRHLDWFIDKFGVKWEFQFFFHLKLLSEWNPDLTRSTISIILYSHLLIHFIGLRRLFCNDLLYAWKWFKMGLSFDLLLIKTSKYEQIEIWNRFL